MLSSRHALNNVALVTWHLLTQEQQQPQQQQHILCLNRGIRIFSQKFKISGITTIKINYSRWSPQYNANLWGTLQFPGRYALRKRNGSSSRTAAARHYHLQYKACIYKGIPLQVTFTYFTHESQSSARQLVNRPPTLGDISQHNGSVISLSLSLILTLAISLRILFQFFFNVTHR
jgi:hypothetical protein